MGKWIAAQNRRKKEMFKLRQRLGSLDQWKKNTLLFTTEGAVGAIALNLINPFVSMFAKRLGAGDFHIGLLSSLPAVVGILALVPGAVIVDRQHDKKQIVGLLIILSGLLYPLAALTPYLGDFSVPVYIIIIALMNWPFSVFNISWQSFFSDVYSGRRSNAAYAGRSMASTLFGITTALLAGLVLSYIPRSNTERVLIYQIFFVSAFFLSLLQRWFLSQISGYTPSADTSSTLALKTVVDCINNLKSDKQFRNFTLTAFLFHVTWQMAWPLFFIYHVDYLHANEAWLSYISVANGIASVVTFSFWSRRIEKKGARMVVIIGCLGLALNPFLTVMSKSLYIILAINILNGLTFSAFQLALFENLLEVVPKKNKTLNIAIYTTFISISGFVSPLMGVWIYKLTSIYFAMILSSVLRLGGAGLFYMRYRKSS